jgi:hypothetical protein
MRAAPNVLLVQNIWTKIHQHAVGLLSSHTILLTHLLTQLRIMGARIEDFFILGE